VTHPKSDVRIQIQRDNRYQEFINNAILTNVMGYRMKVAAKEDLIYGKIWASQDQTRDELKKEKDILDIHRLIEKYPSLKKLADKINKRAKTE
jgi:hypothetical protein